jgi:hypothetical protein
VLTSCYLRRRSQHWETAAKSNLFLPSVRTSCERSLNSATVLPGGDARVLYGPSSSHKITSTSATIAGRGHHPPRDPSAYPLNRARRYQQLPTGPGPGQSNRNAADLQSYPGSAPRFSVQSATRRAPDGITTPPVSRPLPPNPERTGSW